MKSFNFNISPTLSQNLWVTLKQTNSFNYSYFKYNNFGTNYSKRNYAQYFDNKENKKNNNDNNTNINDISFDGLVRKGWLRLKEKGIENSFFEANLLLSKILNKRYPHKNTKISIEQQQKYEEFLSRREEWEPIAYISEEKEFYGRLFKCKRKETLIPRPDSELFVDFSLKLFNSFYLDFIQEMKIIEGGVGTGALVVSIVAEINQFLSQKLDQNGSNRIPMVSAVGVDIHPPALLIAQENISFHQLQNQIQLISSDWFTEIKDLSNYQIILANPPYITEEEMNSLHPTVKLWEPHIALNGGEDGLSHYRKISKQLTTIERAKRKEETLFVLLEIGFSQAFDVVRLFEENNKNLRLVKVEKDLSSLDRLVVFTNNFDLNFDYL